jgi:excisionase family DNA binding protein
MQDLDLLTAHETAKALRVTRRTLSRFRLEHRGPAFMKVGRLVRYARRDVEEYLQANRVGTNGQK